VQSVSDLGIEKHSGGDAADDLFLLSRGAARATGKMPVIGPLDN
jgi:hypothetical protein